MGTMPPSPAIAQSHLGHATALPGVARLARALGWRTSVLVPTQSRVVLVMQPALGSNPFASKLIGITLVWHEGRTLGGRLHLRGWPPRDVGVTEAARILKAALAPAVVDEALDSA